MPDNQIVVGSVPPWLMEIVSKRKSYKSISLPMKEIVTKYAARTPKAKRMKSDARLSTDPSTRKVTIEIVTFKPKEGIREPEVGDF